ncbi:MAG TPA: heparinase II/III family protein [Actinomycetota bacterium]|nr:heparinase II/III family protein [Actinomycetota bacterium]
MSIGAADDLLANRYRFPNHPYVTLPADPTWAEDPIADRNWRFQLHGLWWVENLYFAFDKTGDTRYRDRYYFLLRDWYQDNPRSAPPSDFSWEDHAAAFRGMLYACALQRSDPDPAWLTAAAELHGATLAEDAFYVRHGNHALNQSIGLLDLACVMVRLPWRDLAASRIETLLLESVDAQGVTNEQSEWYQLYNYSRYSLAMSRLEACGVVPSEQMQLRVRAMPRWSAFAAQPNGWTTMIGDTPNARIPSIRGTEVEFVASGGATGLAPDARSQVYNEGYAFFRSGWGQTRDLKDETAVTVRFGPARRFHGHVEPGGVLLSSWGDRILMDPGGPHDLNRTAWQRYFMSELSANVVTVDGRRMNRTGSAQLVAKRSTSAFDYVAVRHTKFRSVIHERRVFYSRRLDVLFVEDHLRSTATERYRQLWHLHPESNPIWYGANGSFLTRKADGPNVRARQLVGGKGRRVVRGATAPIQGWVTYGYKHRVTAPVVQTIARGRDVRYVTMFVPSKTGGRGVSVKSFSLRPRGFSIVLRGSGREVRIAVSATTASEALLS